MSRKKAKAFDYHAHPLKVIKTDKLINRFMKFTELDELTGCWLWKGYACKKRYGRFWCNARHHLAHRVAYAIWNDPLKYKETIDHNCRHTSCVNPEHLVAMSLHENLIKKQERACSIADDF